MKRVTGLVEFSLNQKDTDQVKEWYANIWHCMDQYWCNVLPAKPDGSKGHTVWSLFKPDTDYFLPGDQEFMITTAVEDLNLYSKR